MMASPQVLVVRSGSFSGSAPSLIAALRKAAAVDDVDVMPLARSPRLLPARIRAMIEARLHQPAPWPKTAAWTSALQAHLERAGHLDGSKPVLFIQSLLAVNPSPEIVYGVYTDRVGLEGASVGGKFSSRFSPGWLERERRFLANARYVFVMGPSTKAALTALYGIPDDKISVVGAGPNCPIGEPSPSTECRHLLFVGTQWDLKGGPELLAAFQAARETNRELELRIIGVVPPDPVPPGVRVLGRVPRTEMSRQYRAADALVIPTHMEAFGIAILEALLHGTPCIGTTVGNQPWLIRDAGICVEPGRSDQVESAIRDISANYPQYRAAARRRRDILTRVMNWDVVAERMFESLS